MENEADFFSEKGLEKELGLDPHYAAALSHRRLATAAPRHAAN